MQWDLRFSRRRQVWRWLSSGLLCRVVWLKFTDVSEVLAASTIRVSATTQKTAIFRWIQSTISHTCFFKTDWWHTSKSQVRFPLLRSFQRIRPTLRPCVTFHNTLFHGVFVNHLPKLQVGRPPFVGCPPRLLIQHIRSYPAYLRPSAPSETSGRGMPWWQGIHNINGFTDYIFLNSLIFVVERKFSGFITKSERKICSQRRRGRGAKQADVIRRGVGRGILKRSNKEGTRCLVYRKLGHALHRAAEPKFLPASGSVSEMGRGLRVHSGGSLYGRIPLFKQAQGSPSVCTSNQHSETDWLLALATTPTQPRAAEPYIENRSSTLKPATIA
jgi:hypothetical protein